MKKLRTNIFKRPISAVLAGTLLVTGIGSVTFLKSEKVEAKETLDSITKIVNENNSSNPYNMLEIVPGKVSFTTELLDSYGKVHSVSDYQVGGSLGYYVGGSEPIREDFERIVSDTYNEDIDEYTDSVILDSNMREELANQMIDKLYNDGNGVVNNKKLERSPIEVKNYDRKAEKRYAIYSEIRQGQVDVDSVKARGPIEEKLEVKGMTSDEFSKKSSDMIKLNKDYLGEYHDEKYIDSARGEMIPKAGDNYIKHYYFDDSDSLLSEDSVPELVDDIVPLDEEVDEPNTDLASEFMNAYLELSANQAFGTDYFHYENDTLMQQGDFEPNLNPIKNDGEANVYATFSILDDDASIGYVVTGEQEITKSSNYPEGTPIYRVKNGHQYYYVGTFGEYRNGTLSYNELSDNSINAFNVLEDNYSENIDILDISTFSEEGEDEPESETVVIEDSADTINIMIEQGENVFEEPSGDGGSDSGLSGNDLSGNDISGNDIPDDPDDDPVSPYPNVFEGFYVVNFTYSEMAVGSSHYKVDSFYGSSAEEGAQYVIDTNSEYGIIVPSYYKNGCISEIDIPTKYFVYDYAQEIGNYMWYPAPFDGREPYEGKPRKDYDDFPTYRIRGAEIYYTLNITNNEWFKQWVFDRDKGDDCDNLYLNVYTKTAPEVTMDDVVGCSLLSMAHCDTNYLLGDKEVYYNYYDADISVDVLMEALAESKEIRDSSEDEDNTTPKASLPIIVDYKIVGDARVYSDDSRNTCFAMRLCQALMTDHADLYYNAINGIKFSISENNIDPASVANVNTITDNVNHYVNKNVYIYNMKYSNNDKNVDMINGEYVNLLNPYFYTVDDKKKNPAIKGFNDSEIEEGFAEVLLDIQNENLYRETDNSNGNNNPIKEVVTEATAIRYIIGYCFKRDISGKGEINILEIEPNASFNLYLEGDNQIIDDKSVEQVARTSTYRKKGNDKTSYTGANGTFTSSNGKLLYKDNDGREKTKINQDGLTINLTRMSVGEFIGHIEDLNAEYDLIYFGTNTDLYNTSTKTKKVWVDPYEIPEQVYKTVYIYDEYALQYYYGYSWWGPTGNTIDEDAYNALPDYQKSNYERTNNTREKLLDAATVEDIRKNNPNELNRTINYGKRVYRIVPYEYHPGGYIDKQVKTTVYNDTTMNGLVYTNVGDYVYMGEAILGNLAQDYQSGIKGNGRLKNNTSYYDVNSPVLRSRYSGNDITEEKVKQLKEFVNAGYPVVFADDFFKNVTTDTRVIDTDIIDSMSYMYDFANSVKDKKNVFAFKNMTGKLFNWYLNLDKPSVTMYEESLLALSDTQKLTKNTSDGYYYATFDFEISNKGAATSDSTYNAALYIDVNADGKYSHSQEGIAFTKLRETSGDAVSGVKDANNNTVYSLKTGVRYSATCRLAGSFLGVLPWRLEITQNDNPVRRANATGYYNIVADNKPTIDVLQINQSVNGFNNQSGTYSNWNMQTTSQNYDTNKDSFYSLLNSDTVPYHVNIVNMTKEQFESAVAVHTEDNYYKYITENGCVDAKGNHKGYDMLVLGFSDVYLGVNEQASKAIKRYINDGYSILFTHDCTSFINAPDSAYSSNLASVNSGGSVWKWGYDFNTYVRNVVGLDRYNILNNTESTHIYDKPYAPKSGTRAEGNGSVLGETQGFTYFVLNFYGYHNGTGDKYGRGMPSLYNLSKGVRSDDNGQADNKIVTKVNDGQITRFPYKLSDCFDVANTHGQYYQIDMNADDDLDGESDIVVWYCISDDANSYANDMYEVSPNDVRNNYYIYNKGNVTYSGVGHSSVIDKGSLEEKKLFVNTLIAAYRTGIHEPDLTIVDGYGDNAKTSSSIFVSFDKYLKANGLDGNASNGVLEMTEDLYFNTSKVSLVQNSAYIEHNVSVKFYYEVDSTVPGAVALDTVNGTVYGKEIDISDADSSNKKFCYLDASGNEVAGNPNALLDNVTYKVKIPVTIDKVSSIWTDYSVAPTSKALNTRNIFVVATDTSKNLRSGKVSQCSSVGITKLVRTQVFDLD